MKSRKVCDLHGSHIAPLSNWFNGELGLMDKLEMASDVVAVIAKCCKQILMNNPTEGSRASEKVDRVATRPVR